jgi:ferritin-like metal-binding protein YciE
MKRTETPRDLFFDQLRDIYSMEMQLLDAFPDLVRLTTHPPLRNLVAGYLAGLEVKAVKIGEIFRRFDVKIGDDKCKAVEGLVAGGESHLREVGNTATRDLMMIAHCLRITRYATAACEITRRLADRLALEREAGELATLLDDEERAAGSLMALEPEIFQAASVS